MGAEQRSQVAGFFAPSTPEWTEYDRAKPSMVWYINKNILRGTGRPNNEGT